MIQPTSWTFLLLLTFILGAITISNQGDVGIGFSSKAMAWAYQKGNKIHYGIRHNDHKVDLI